MSGYNDLLRKLEKQRIGVSVEGNNLRISPGGKDLDEEMKRLIRDHKQALIQHVRGEERSGFSGIPRALPATDYPLSSSQRRLWMLCQQGEASRAYNMPAVYSFSGELDPGALQAAFDLLISRHEILRTVFREGGDGTVRQCVLPAADIGFRLSVVDLRDQVEGEEGVGMRVREMVQVSMDAPFDLSEGPLLRAELYRLAAGKWVFVYNMHHIISDGWSMGILISELLSFYGHYRRGEVPDLPPLSIQYKDYALWQQGSLRGEKQAAHKAYWLEQLSGGLPVLELPGDRARPAVKSFQGGMVKWRIAAERSRGLVALGRERKSTLFMSLLALVNAMLYRYTGQEDIIIGSPIAGRDHADLEGQIGFYVNTLALRARFDGGAGFDQLLERIRGVMLGAYEHQSYPFDELVEELGLKRDMSRNILFDVMVVLHQQEMGSSTERITEDLQVGGYAGLGHRSSKVDLLFSFNEEGDALQMNIEYNSDIYDRSTILRMAGHLERLLGAIIRDPAKPLISLDYLSGEERELLTDGFNGGEVGYPEKETIVSIFERQARKTPDLIALSYEGASLSYRQLDELASQLGYYLRSRHGIGRDDLVGVKLPRSQWMVVVLMGVLKAGGAYVPVEPDYPADRLEYILSDSGCKVLIDEAELERFRRWSRRKRRYRCPCVNEPGDLAYVIYTSGTTGRPKGVLIEHRNVVRLLHTDRPLFDFGEQDVWTMFHSYCFDFSVWEMYGALLNGGRLVIVPQLTARDPSAFLELVVREGVTVLNQTPSAFYNFTAREQEEGGGNKLRYIIFGGEALLPERLRGWRERHPGVRLINMYGITETTVHVTYKEITEVEIARGDSNIGKPIPTLRCYVVDKGGLLAPVGVPGELLVGGEGLARGYLNKVELTRERFIESPFRKGERLYRSGDIVKLTEDGEMHYYGRRDEQVKIRGYRIELGEIARALEVHRDVSAAVVCVWQGASGEKELVAYVVAAQMDVRILRAHLAGMLPGYMIPAYFVGIDELPLTVNGKVDKKRLPAPEQGGIEGTEPYVATEGVLEQKLAAAFSEVLGVAEASIGRMSNFFSMGGNSMKALKLQTLLKRKYNVGIKISELYNGPTIESLAAGRPDGERLLRLNNVDVGSRGTVFFVPPLLGNSIIYKNLAERLPEFSCRGLQYRGLEQGEEFYSSIGEAVAEFCEAILKQEIKGPVILVGYSMGVAVAFEMAKVLEGKFGPMELVLIDRGTVGDIVTIEDLEASEANGELSIEVRVNWLMEQYGILMKSVTGAGEEDGAAEIMPDGASLARLRSFLANNLQIAKDYVLHGTVGSLIRVFEATENKTHTAMKRWDAYTDGGIVHTYLEGEHWDALTGANLDTLAAAINSGR